MTETQGIESTVEAGYNIVIPHFDNGECVGLNFGHSLMTDFDQVIFAVDNDEEQDSLLHSFAMSKQLSDYVLNAEGEEKVSTLYKVIMEAAGRAFIKMLSGQADHALARVKEVVSPEAYEKAFSKDYDVVEFMRMTVAKTTMMESLREMLLGGGSDNDAGGSFEDFLRSLQAGIDADDDE